jgi:hypothetical protein
MTQTELVKPIDRSIEFYPHVTNEDLAYWKKNAKLVCDNDLLRKYDIRYRPVHELTPTQRKQLRKVLKQEADLRRVYPK